MSNTSLRAEFNVKFGMLSVYASVRDIRFICTSYTRTAAEQRKLFDAGKSMCDGKDSTSLHQRDRARDIVILDADDQPVWVFTPEYTALGQFWEQMGGVWGGRWTEIQDPYHFQF